MNRCDKRKLINQIVMLITLVTPLSAWAAGVTIKGYVSNGPTVPVSGAQVILTNSQGQQVASDTTGWTGGYKLKNIDNGQYVLSTGQFATTINVSGESVRQDFDLTRPGGTFSWGQYAIEESLKLIQQAAAEEAAREKRAQSAKSRGSHSSGNDSIDASLGNTTCYSGTCESTGYGTTINYGIDGSISEY